MADYLACANCGCPITNGELCNLTCRREWLKKNEAQGSQTTARDEVHAFISRLVNEQQRAVEIKLHAKQRAGQMLVEGKKAGDVKSAGQAKNSDRAVRIPDIGITHRESSEFQKLAFPFSNLGLPTLIIWLFLAPLQKESRPASRSEVD